MRDKKLKEIREKNFKEKRKFHKEMGKIPFRKKLETLIKLRKIAKELKKEGIVWKNL